MGYPRRRPQRLAEKLKEIRQHLRLSQSELVRRMGVDIHYTNLSKFEKGTNEPDLLVLLAYARVSGVTLEDLADDKIDLLF